MQRTPSPALACVYLCVCLFLFLSLSVLPAGCLFASSLLLPLPAAATAVSCLRIECIAFNIYSLLFPFSTTFFFFFFAAHIFLSFGTRETRKIQNREQKTPPSGGRGKLKMRLRLKLHDKRIAKCCMFSSSSSGSRDSALSLPSPTPPPLPPAGLLLVYHDTLNKSTIESRKGVSLRK